MRGQGFDAGAKLQLAPGKVLTLMHASGDIVRVKGAAGGVAAAGLLAVSITFWNWATQAKFYSLHFAFVAGLLWLALRTRRALDAAASSGLTLAPRWSPSAWPPAIRLLHLLALMAGLAYQSPFYGFQAFAG